MGSLDDLLRDGESVEVETRRHGGLVLQRLVLLVLVLGLVSTVGSSLRGDVGTLVLRWGTIAAAAVLGGRVLVAGLRWSAEGIMLTDRRLLASTGLLRRRVTSLPLRRIRDVSLERSFGGRIFGFGDVLVDMEDRRLRLHRVPDPRGFYRALLDVLDAEDTGHQAFTIPDDQADTGPLPRISI